MKFDEHLIYDHGLSYTEWRTGVEILELLANNGLIEREKTGHFKDHGSLYVYLYRLSRQGYVKSRYREEDSPEDNLDPPCPPPKEFVKTGTKSRTTKEKTFSLDNLVLEPV